MGRLRIATIVEGYGEVAALPTLLERIWYELIGGEYLEILRPPIRQPRNKLAQNKDDALSRAVELAASKLIHTQSMMSDPELILVLIDADKDPPCLLGPTLLKVAHQARGDKNISCVIANVEYETWFVASAESLTSDLDLSGDADLPEDPESLRLGKGWIEKRFRGVKYSERVDQPKMTAKMDLNLCRGKSPSFDKLCRDLESMVNQ